jgi:hypothetical protein
MAQCSNCGSPLSDAQKFCPTCGTVAEQTAASAAATPPAATPPPVPPPVPTPPPAFIPPAYPPQGAAPQGYPPQAYNQQTVYGPGGYPNAAWQAPKKSNKSLWIGLSALVVVLAVAAVLIFGVFWDKVSGGGGGGGGSDASAQQMLAASWTASENAANASGSYEASITLETDTSGMSAEEQQMAGSFLGSPITFSGTFSTTQSPTAVDLTVAGSLFGQNIDAGLRLLDGKPWILFSGQWYDAPPDLLQSMASSGTTPDAGAIKDLLTNLAIDPSKWLKDVKEAGSEDIDGVKTVHLTGTPDLAKMITDITALMQSPEGQNLMNLAGSASGSTDTSTETSTSMPTAQEIADLQTQLESMLQKATIDLWLSKDDNSIRKVALDLQIVPPAEDASADSSSALSGLSSAFKSIKVTASVTLASGQPAAIVAPESPLPYTDLQNALSSDTGLLGMLLGSGSGLNF